MEAVNRIRIGTTFAAFSAKIIFIRFTAEFVVILIIKSLHLYVVAAGNQRCMEFFYH